MTGYTVNTGSNEKFSEGWDKIFGKKSSKKATPAASANEPKTESRPGKKTKKK
jgi:hypothetical protein